MDSKEFIYKELQAFINNFPKTRIRYEYDKDAIVHVVEVVPNKIYHDNDYIKWENDLFTRFVTLFPTENICFISDDAIVGIAKAEFILEGLQYAPITSSQKITNIINTNIINTTTTHIEIPFPKIEINYYSFKHINQSNSYHSSNILKAA